MPIRSRSQWRKMRLLLRQGKISRKEWNEWVKGVNFQSLPERVPKKRKTKKRRR